MEKFKEVTITLFVKPADLTTLITVLKVLDGLGLENDYVFTPSDIEYYEDGRFNFFSRINVPIELYLKFKYCYNKLKK